MRYVRCCELQTDVPRNNLVLLLTDHITNAYVSVVSFYNAPSKNFSAIVMFLFWPLLPPQYMYNCLMAWAEHNNRDNKNIAISAMDAFFEQVREL